MTPEDLRGHILNEILADFGAYMEPNLFKDEYKDSLIASTFNKKELKKYNRLLSSVHYAWRKTIKYEIYFSEFYSNSDKLEKFEQLNHHMHAYLQDADTLKNKIQNLFGALKNDIKKVAINKDEVSEFLDAGIEKTTEVFEGILQHRREHVHHGTRFMDGDLLKAENAFTSIQLMSQPVFDAMLNQDRKAEVLARLEKQKDEAFEVAKARWVKTAHDNNVQTAGYLDAILKALKTMLYDYLNIKEMKVIMESVDKSIKST